MKKPEVLARLPALTAAGARSGRRARLDADRGPPRARPGRSRRGRHRLRRRRPGRPARPDGAPGVGPRDGLPPAGRAARASSRTSSGSTSTTTPSTRTPPWPTSPRWSRPPAARSASRCAGAGRSARRSGRSGLAFQLLLMYPFVALFYRVRTTGMEALHGLDGPVLITPEPLPPPGQRDHPQPPPALGPLEAVRGGRRRDDLRQPGPRASSPRCSRTPSPWPREGSVRRSLELLGSRLDRGYNILLYPEGKLTVGGPLQPFKAGAGLIAVEGGTPIVPVKLRINRMSIIDRRRLPELRSGVTWSSSSARRSSSTPTPTQPSPRSGCRRPSPPCSPGPARRVRRRAVGQDAWSTSRCGRRAQCGTSIQPRIRRACGIEYAPSRW